MVEEYCSWGALNGYIRKQKFFTEKTAANILFQLLNYTNYLHKKILFIKTRKYCFC